MTGKKSWAIAGSTLAATAALLTLALPAFGTSQSYAQSTSRTFPETGHTVSGNFLTYWNGHGGLAQQGLPISDLIQEKSDTDGKTYQVQYFERAVFEMHPELQAPNNVLLSLLGNFLYKQKYPTGASAQTVNTTAGAQKFTQTGHTVGGLFLQYWNSHGGLAQQGYPISEEFNEKSDLNGQTYKVQYFQRAVFEYHPENQAPYNVLLSQLGTFRYKAKYAAAGGAVPTATTAPASNQATVMVKDFEFDPASITVAVGTTVTWVFVGPTVHNTVSKDSGPDRLPLWHSDILQPGQKFSYTFTKAGTYNYQCTLHPIMQAVVIVK